MMTKSNSNVETAQSQTSDSCKRNGKDCCSSGGCSGPGLCPGVALFIAYLVGTTLTLLTGSVWLGWAVGLPTALILLTGAWRYLPSKAKSSKQ